MSKTAKHWLIVAICLIVVGGLLFGGVTVALNGDLRKLSTVTYQTNEYVVSEVYTDIVVTCDTADVVFVTTDADTTVVTCHEQEKRPYTVTVVDGALTVTERDEREWYDHVGVDFEQETLTVALPKGTYGALTVAFGTGDVTVPSELSFSAMNISGSTGHVTTEATVSGNATITATTGDIRVENAVIGALDLAVSSGQITVTDVTCQETLTVAVSTGDTAMSGVRCRHLLSDGSTGDLQLRDVVVGKTVTIERSTGDVQLQRCDAAQLYIRTDTGDVTGSLLSKKTFLADSDTGTIDVPVSLADGGTCEIVTDTGDIRLNYAE